MAGYYCLVFFCPIFEQIIVTCSSSNIDEPSADVKSPTQTQTHMHILAASSLPFVYLVTFPNDNYDDDDNDIVAAAVVVVLPIVAFIEDVAVFVNACKLIPSSNFPFVFMHANMHRKQSHICIRLLVSCQFLSSHASHSRPATANTEEDLMENGYFENQQVEIIMKEQQQQQIVRRSK